MKAQDYDVVKNIILQDNKSAILLEKNGKKSSGKKTKANQHSQIFFDRQDKQG